MGSPMARLERARKQPLMIHTPFWGRREDGSPYMFAAEHFRYAFAAVLCPPFMDPRDVNFDFAFQHVIDSPAPNIRFLACSGLQNAITTNFLGGSSGN
jgi:hypothetical protein